MLATRVAAVAAAAALAGSATLPATASATAVMAGPRAVASGPGHWSQVTPNGTATLADIGLARGSRGVLNVIWASAVLSDGQAKIQDTPISSAGVVGHPATVVAQQYTVTYPDATVAGSRIDVLWNGVASSAPSAPQGTFESTRSLAGGSWSTPANIPPLTAIPFLSSSNSATTGSDGKASGPRSLLPGSQTKGFTVGINQRVAITGRGHGRSGVYVAYETGYPETRGLDLLRLGAAKPVKLASFSLTSELGGAAVTASPSGGLWVAWFDGRGTAPRLFGRVSNASVRKFGPTLAIKLPSGTSEIWKVYISAQASRLDVLVLLTRHGRTAYWATEVR